MQNKGVFIIGLLLILFGVIFLLANIEFIDLAKIWPLIPLLVGIGFLISFFQSKKDYGLLMPGSILTIVSLLLFYCNLSLDHKIL